MKKIKQDGNKMVVDAEKMIKDAEKREEDLESQRADAYAASKKEETEEDITEQKREIQLLRYREEELLPSIHEFERIKEQIRNSEGRLNALESKLGPAAAPSGAAVVLRDLWVPSVPARGRGSRGGRAAAPTGRKRATKADKEKAELEKAQRSSMLAQQRQQRFTQ